jgi:hypothetical protein
MGEIGHDGIVGFNEVGVFEAKFDLANQDEAI